MIIFLKPMFILIGVFHKNVRKNLSISLLKFNDKNPPFIFVRNKYKTRQCVLRNSQFTR